MHTHPDRSGHVALSAAADYEPPAAPADRTVCPAPSARARRGPRRGPAIPAHRPTEEPVPHSAVVFADAAMRRVLEVIDRRRPPSQLRPALTPTLVATVAAHSRLPHAAPAVLRRVRLRMAGPGMAAAEVFASYARGERVRAVAARIELTAGRWQVVALQIG